MRHLLLVFFSLFSCKESESAPAPTAAASDEASDEDLARTVIDKHLRAPATAQYREITIEEKGPNGWRLALVEVDSQNGFGALIRSRYHVVFRRAGGQRVEWVRLGVAVQEVGPFETPSNIEVMKSENGWPREFPKGRPDQTMTIGGLSVDEVKQGVGAHVSDLRACFPKRLKQEMLFSIFTVITPFGDALSQETRIEGIDEKSPAFECIKLAMARWQFPQRTPTTTAKIAIHIPISAPPASTASPTR